MWLIAGLFAVMAGLAPAIHVFGVVETAGREEGQKEEPCSYELSLPWERSGDSPLRRPGVDGRDTPGSQSGGGHDARASRRSGNGTVQQLTL